MRRKTCFETLFKDVEVRQPLLAGPMGPYLDVLTSRLLELGYCHSQARKIVRIASALGHWLTESGLTPVQAGKADLEKFIGQQGEHLQAGLLTEPLDAHACQACCIPAAYWVGNQGRLKMLSFTVLKTIW